MLASAHRYGVVRRVLRVARSQPAGGARATAPAPTRRGRAPSFAASSRARSRDGDARSAGRRATGRAASRDGLAARAPWRRALLAAPFVVAFVALLTGACFDGDETVAYAPCRSSEACRDAGLLACVIRPDVADAPGFCAPACAEPCPAALDGDAPASCMTIDGESLCVLDCDADITCPSGQECRTIADADGASRGLCFPDEGAP